MKFTLGFSPCPNDTFIFDALVNKKIDTKGFEFDVVLEDVQTLNKWALQHKLDFSKISYGVLPLITKHYTVLNSGGALGNGVGPLLVAKQNFNLQDLQKKTIAIPGENTTAHLLFSYAFKNCNHKVFKVFHEIENAVLRGDVDAGVIIHENRFTYADKGLVKLADLGELWEKKLKLPIPLGAIVANKNISTAIALQMDELIKESVEYAFANNSYNASFIKQNAQEMSEQVMQQHIALYVNKYSIKLGEDGKNAVRKLMEVYEELHHLQPPFTGNYFIA